MALHGRVFGMALAVALGAAGCSGSEGPCALVQAPAQCGQRCEVHSDCAEGYYCGDDNVCTADCFAGSSRGCSSGQVCTNQGRCKQAAGLDGGGGDAIAPADGSTGDGNNVCADVVVEARRVTPNVILIVDQSGSMTTRFSDSGDRWNVLRDSLLANPDGLIFELQSLVRFGVALYSARSEDGNDGGPPVGECPMIESVAPAIDNYDAIQSTYGGADPIEDTPTGDAIDAVLDDIASTPDPGDDPTVFILATDGEPDRCEELDPNPTPEARAEAVTAVERAFDRGIRTFYIDVGNGVGPSHKQAVANAGIGVGPGDPDAPYWTVTDDTGLRDALREIVGGELSCELELDGRIQSLEDACDGRVELNGEPLPCDDPNGWRAIDETHIELQGDACDRLENDPGVRLEATFPCDTIII